MFVRTKCLFFVTGHREHSHTLCILSKMIVTAWVCLGLPDVCVCGWGGGDNNPQPEVYKKMYPGRVQSKKNRLNLQVTLKIDLKVMMVKVMYTLTFHRLL